MADGRRVTLGRKELGGLLRSAAFFEACPALADMAGRAAIAAATLKALGKKACCGRDWKVIGPVVNELYDRLRAAKAERHETVEHLREHLGANRGYRVGKVVLFYRDKLKGPPRRLEL